MKDDATLLRCFAEEKSEAAFAELVRRHLDLVYSTALRQLAGDTHLAQDVAQTVFTALARKAPSLTDRLTLSGWLYLGAHHAAAQAVRGEQRRRGREQEASLMHEPFSSATPPPEWEQVRPVLDEAMRELSEPDREAVLLRYFEKRPFAEIGATLRVSDDAARMRVERALEKLRALLARRGITSATAALSAVLTGQATVAAPAGLAATVTGAALAGAWVSGAAVATGIFMKTSTVLLSGVALTALAAAIYQTSQTQHVRDELALLAKERDGLRAQMNAAHGKDDQAAQKIASLQKEVEATRAAGAKLSVAAAKTAAGALSISAATAANDGGGLFYLAQTSSDPVEARKQAKAREGANTDDAYRALYRQLGWTEAQQEQFRDLRFERSEAGSKLFSAAVKAAREKNPNFDRADMADVAAATALQRQADEQAEVRRLFGDTTAQALERYETSRPLRYVTGQLASGLLFTDTPLTPAQGEQVIDVLTANARGADGRVELVALNVEAAVAQAQGILNATQLAELRRVGQRMQEQARLEKERNRGPFPTLTSKPSGG